VLAPKNYFDDMSVFISINACQYFSPSEAAEIITAFGDLVIAGVTELVLPL